MTDKPATVTQPSSRVPAAVRRQQRQVLASPNPGGPVVIRFSAPRQTRESVKTKRADGSR